MAHTLPLLHGSYDEQLGCSIAFSSLKLGLRGDTISRLYPVITDLLSQELHPDTTRTGLWLQSTAIKPFNVCRSPQLVCDDMVQIPPHSVDRPHRALVMIYDWFYLLDIYPSSTTSNCVIGNTLPLPLNVATLEHQLRAIVTDAQERRMHGERAVPIGVLSADDRDTWAKVNCYPRQNPDL
jgi:hypothetical protein